MKRKESRVDLVRSHQPAAVVKRLHQAHPLSYASDAVLGGIDGCVTTFAIAAAAVGAEFDSVVVIVLGAANLFADGFSMAISNYQASKANEEYRDELRRTEERHIELIPEGEREELRQIYRQKGFQGEMLEAIVETISHDRRLWIETMLSEEYGLPKSLPVPSRSALTTFAAFLVVGAVPLLPFLFSGAALLNQFAASIVLAGFMFFAIGVAKGLVVGRSMFLAGVETLLLGSGAAALAFVVGYLLRATFGAV